MAKVKKAQAGDSLVKKYPSVRMTTRKGYETKETTYPNGDKETLKTKVVNKAGDTYEKNKKARLNEAAKKSAIQSSKEVSSKKATKAKDGKWIQKVSKSIKARGTEGKCTPITKPGCTGKAKALAKTFKKIAAKRKAK